MVQPVVAVIPARSGSKGIPDKNIAIVGGKPLLAHSILHALECSSVDRVILDTDSEEYAEIGRSFGAEAPYLRPTEFAQDESTDFDVFNHLLHWMNENEGSVPELLVHLRPTCPIRSVSDMDRMIKKMQEDPSLDSMRSISDAAETPFKMWFQDEAGLLSPVVTCEVPEAYNQPRQVLPKAYVQNACIDVLRSRVVLDQSSMTGRRIMGYLMDTFYDIDTEMDLATAVDFLEFTRTEASGSKRFVFDIDGILAKVEPKLDYSKSEPLVENIAIVNRLYEMGHTIVLFTARGSASGIDWTELTEQQMRRWGVKFHELRLGKPHADYYVDDKFIPMGRLRSAIND